MIKAPRPASQHQASQPARRPASSTELVSQPEQASWPASQPASTGRQQCANKKCDSTRLFVNPMRLTLTLGLLTPHPHLICNASLRNDWHPWSPSLPCYKSNEHETDSNHMAGGWPLIH